MCGRFTGVTWDELVRVAREISSDAKDAEVPEWPARPIDIFPKRPAPLILSDAESPGALTPGILVWGYELDGRRDVIFNTRIENAPSSPLWRDSFLSRRCVVPAHAFFEPHRSEKAVNPSTGKAVKQVYRFDDPDSLLLLAGIWREGRFSVLTTEPDSQMEPIHPRMPVMYDLDETRRWLRFEEVPRPSDARLRIDPIYPEPEQGSLF